MPLVPRLLLCLSLSIISSSFGDERWREEPLSEILIEHIKSCVAGFDDRLLVANVGDSHAVISRGGKAFVVSRDHKLDRSDERQRIEDAGGFVMWAGTWRVDGFLAVSRAFGDKLLSRRPMHIEANHAGIAQWVEPNIQGTLGCLMLCSCTSFLSMEALTHIVFTSGVTECNNISDKDVMHLYKEKKKHIVTTSRYVVTTSRYVVPTGRVKVPAGRYVVPTGKDNVIVSAGRTKVIPAGRTILVLVVLCLLRVDRIVSDILKRTKTKPKRTKPSTGLEECEKSKPKAYTSLNGPTLPHIPQQSCNPPNIDDWDCLFQPMFDEYFNPPTIAVSPVPVAAEPRAVDIVDSPVSVN
ncbi:probable protein phosphatase 2C 59 [Tanacetum coccineum]